MSEVNKQAESGSGPINGYPRLEVRDGKSLLCGRFAARDDERLLLKTLQSRDKPYVREVVRELNINENRAAYICQKWTDRGWYNYGVNVLAGWLEGDGLSAA